MLSIDITDRQIKLVRGTSQGSKIKIDEVDFREIEKGLVSNGYIADVPLVAAEIIDMINTRAKLDTLQGAYAPQAQKALQYSRYRGYDRKQHGYIGRL